MIREIIKNYIIIGLIMIIIDGFYLSIIGKPVFSKTVYKIQNSPLVMKIVPAIMTYILLVIVLDYFIIKEKKNPIDAFILGLCIYGVFDFTNLILYHQYAGI